MMPGDVALGFVILTMRFRREDRYWLGECEELGTATDGRSLEKVREELRNLVTLHLNALEEAGERDQVFKERGIKLYTDQLPQEVNRSVPVDGTNETLVEVRRVQVPAHRADPAVV